MSREEDFYPHSNNLPKQKSIIDDKWELVDCIRVAIEEKIGNTERLTKLLTFTQNINLNDHDFKEQIDNNTNALKNIVTPFTEDNETKQQIDLIKRLDYEEIESMLKMELLLRKIVEYSADDTVLSNNRLKNLFRAIYLFKEEISRIKPLLLRTFADINEVNNELLKIQNLILDQASPKLENQSTENLSLSLTKLKKIISLIRAYGDIDKNLLQNLHEEHQNRINSAITTFKDYIALISTNTKNNSERAMLNDVEDQIVAAIEILKKIKSTDSNEYCFTAIDQPSSNDLDTFNPKLNESFSTINKYPFNLLNDTLYQLLEIITDDQTRWEEKAENISELKLFNETEYSNFSSPSKLKGLIDLLMIEAIRTHHEQASKIKAENTINEDGANQDEY